MNAPPRVPALIEIVEKRAAKFAEVLPPSVKVQKFVAAARTALLTVPGLLECDPQSVLIACMRCATDGLVPDGRDAVLVVGQSKRDGQWVKIAQYWPMVQGLQKIVYRSGRVRRIEARVVYEADVFELAYGSTPHITHVPRFPKGEITAVYVIATLAQGDQLLEVMDRDEVDAIMRRSKSWDRVKNVPQGPWKTDYAEMARKTVVRRIMKYLPTEAAAHDDDDAEPPTIEGELAPGQPRMRVEEGIFSSGTVRLAETPVDELDATDVAEAELVEAVAEPAAEKANGQSAKSGDASRLDPEPSDVTIWKGRLRDLRTALETSSDLITAEAVWTAWEAQYTPFPADVRDAAEGLVGKRATAIKQAAADYAAAKG